jgi:carboxyl-terminal processing protease
MVYGAIQGMVASLDDPYTVFLPPKQNKSSNEDLAGAFGGVGIQLGYKDKILAVMAPLPKTPADKAGVKAGDLILKIIDKEKKLDKDTSGIALDEAVNLIRGKMGTEVTLKLFREGKKESFDVTMKRDNIVVPSLELEIKEVKGKKFAWVKLYKFSDQLYKDWPELVDKIIVERNKDGANFGGIVLDLRNNPGGFLQASVLVASDFIKEGVIVKQASANGQDQTYMVEKGRGKLLNDKLVVLINGGSASASEILAGALKDYNRAKLVGDKSFGKGTVQSPQDFPDGSGLHITIAKWLLPSGKNIHGEGVMPDVEVKFVDNDKKTDNQFDKAVETLQN